MSFYLDTSVVVSGLTREPSTEDVLQWLGAADPGTLVTSEWTRTEVASALARKVRDGKLSPSECDDALVRFRRLVRDGLEIVPVRTRHFEAASAIVGRPELRLRAGDALHLAIAQEEGLVVCTLDVRMAEAAKTLNGRVVGPDLSQRTPPPGAGGR